MTFMMKMACMLSDAQLMVFGTDDGTSAIFLLHLLEMGIADI